MAITHGMPNVTLVTDADAGLFEGRWECSNISRQEAKMAKNLDVFRLSQPDPWDVVAGAREQRGAIVAGWCMAVLALLWTCRPRADLAPQRRCPADLSGRAVMAVPTEMTGHQGASI